LIQDRIRWRAVDMIVKLRAAEKAGGRGGRRGVFVDKLSYY
jgi:hypothetical protein